MVMCIHLIRNYKVMKVNINIMTNKTAAIFIDNGKKITLAFFLFRSNTLINLFFSICFRKIYPFRFSLPLQFIFAGRRINIFFPFQIKLNKYPDVISCRKFF
ncbi:hypothetical protein CRG93_09560 [Escherichia sp. E2593]|nr:hypothetical protein CRG93_09560 [Escherichia sp. E2593]